MNGRETRFLKASKVWFLSLALRAAILAGCEARKTGMARGQELYDTCVPCHGRNGAGNIVLRAPSIAGLPEWYVEAQLTKFAHGVRGAHPSDDEGARMRPMARTLKGAPEIAAMAAYVSHLAPQKPSNTLVGGDATAGKTRYEGLCITCHGPEGRGNTDIGSPDLSHQADWYMLAQLVKFKGRVEPNAKWVGAYAKGLAEFEGRIR